jgi:molecular chaperone GrpE
MAKDKKNKNESDEPVVPTGSASEAPASEPAAAEPHSEDGDTANVESAEDLIAAEGPDVEVSDSDIPEVITLTDEEVKFFEEGEKDLIAEVIRSLLPAIDDLARAETHGDLTGSPLELVAQKIRGGFEKYGLRSVGVKGEPFDPHFHEALVQVPSADVKVNTIADVIETGYALGDRLIRAAKVAVLVPSE